MKKLLAGLLITTTLMTGTSLVTDVYIKPIKIENTTRSTKQDATYKNVIMVYLVGSDLESQDQAGKDDIQEMLEAKYGKDTTIVIQTGGSSKWHKVGNVKIANDKLQRYVIKDGKLELIETLKNDNMGKAEVLNSFIKFSQKNFKGLNEHLVLWSHGAGPVYGFGTDELHDGDSLTLEELQQAFKGTKKLKSIVFDACLMGNAETAFALSNYADYMLSSAELAPGSGLNYKGYIERMAKGDISSLTTSDLENFTAGEHDTLTLVDLSKAKKLMIEVAKMLDANKAEEIRNAAIKSIAYGGDDSYSEDDFNYDDYEDGDYDEEDADYDDYDDSEYADENDQDYSDEAYEDEGDFFSQATDLFDLNGLVDNLKQSDKVKQVLKEMVIANYTSENFSKSTGLSIYLPIKDGEFTTDDVKRNMDEINLPAGYLKKILSLASMANNETELNFPTMATDSWTDDMADEEGQYSDEASEWNDDWNQDEYNEEYEQGDETSLLESIINFFFKKDVKQ